jgi:hypothetical protein
MFVIIAGFVLILCQALIGSFIYKAASQDEMRWVTTKSLAVYTEAAKTLLTSSGIAVAIVVAGLGGKVVLPMWMLRRSIDSLIACILCSVAFIVVLSRWWEVAASRERGDLERGRLTWFELSLVLVFADVALSAFFLGFLYLARIVYWI